MHLESFERKKVGIDNYIPLKHWMGLLQVYIEKYQVKVELERGRSLNCQLKIKYIKRNRSKTSKI